MANVLVGFSQDWWPRARIGGLEIARLAVMGVLGDVLGDPPLRAPLSLLGHPISLHCLMISAQFYGMPAQAHLAFSWVPWGTHEKQGVPRDVSKDPSTANLVIFLSEVTFFRGVF